MTRTIRTDVVLGALTRAGELVAQRGELPVTFEDLTDDSRRVSRSSIFVAVRGTAQDGHLYLDAAQRAGAVAAVVEDPSRTTLPVMVVRNTRRAAACAAAAVYGEPGRQLTLVAVTGTNGKTTTVGMLRHLLDEPDAPSASIGTLGALVGSGGRVLPGGGGLTTPGPVELQRLLRELVDAGARRVAMEVSSHSLDQHRIEGIEFAAAVFTNISHEHLDYHGTMDAYVAAKAKLLAYLAADGVAVVNADDRAWDALDPTRRRIRFGLRAPHVDVTARDVTFAAEGSDWTLGGGGIEARVHLPLMGDFNVANALGAAAAGWSLGLAIPIISARLGTMPQVPGRLERIHDAPVVLRDYAHKPFALESALRAVRPFVSGRLIVVFGCGGDRDRAKRPLMGAIAEREADAVIITSDNPRTEDPERILDEIEAGMTSGRHERIEDRRAAIARALELASPTDVVLLAGKGHETYQIRGTTSLHFDESEIVRELTDAARGAGR